jgi:hypothetical protein
MTAIYIVLALVVCLALAVLNDFWPEP